MMHQLILCLLVSRFSIGSCNIQCGNRCVCQSGYGEVTAHCTNVGLTSWPEDLPLNITTLDISHNPLAHLQELPLLPNLHRLDARYCGLKSVSHDLLNHMPELEELQLGHNKMVAFPEVKSQGKVLKSLSLDHNKIQALGPGILTGAQLDQLDLQENSLSIIHPESFKGASIMTLSLNWCSIDPKAITNANSPFHYLSNSLKHLFWSYNSEQLQNMPQDIFAGLRLDRLQLTHDGLRDPMFLESNMTVKDLDVSHNTLSELDITACCSNIVTAKFSNCSIYRLNNNRQPQSGARTTLEVLDVAFNKLTYISSAVLAVMVNLKELNVQGNPLSKLGYNTQIHTGFVELKLFTVTDTPISCDCQNECINFLYRAGTALQGIHCVIGLKLLSGLGSSLCSEPHEISIYRNGSKKVVTCSAKGIPLPKIEWACDGEAQDSLGSSQNRNNGSSDVLNTVDMNPACSTLSCTASNLKGSKTVVLNLVGQTPVVISSSTESKHVNKVVILSIVVGCAVLLAISVSVICIFKGKLQSKCDKHYVRNAGPCPETPRGHCQSELLINSQTF